MTQKVIFATDNILSPRNIEAVFQNINSTYFENTLSAINIHVQKSASTITKLYYHPPHHPPHYYIFTKSQEGLKHSLIYILMILSKRSVTIFNNVFQSFYQKIYNERPLEMFLVVEKLKMPNLYVNWQGSCYLDSLLACIFFAKLPLFDKMKEVNHPLTSRLVLGYQESSGTIQRRCINIRKEVMKIIPHSYASFGVSNVYDVLTDVYHLKVDIPRIVVGGLLENMKWKTDLLTTFNTGMISMWDFMDISATKTGEGTIYLWDGVRCDYLVFQNTLAPVIRGLDDPAPERTLDEVQTAKTGKRVITKSHKGQVFGEYILGCKYRLSAVIMQQGHRPSFGSDHYDGHYCAYIRSKFNVDAWFYYDDLEDGRWKFVGDKPPEEVFRDTKNSRPELYFYERVRPVLAKVVMPKRIKETWRGKEITTHTFRTPESVMIIVLFPESFQGKFTYKSTKAFVENGKKVMAWKLTPKKASSLLTEIKAFERKNQISNLILAKIQGPPVMLFY